jgi:hypothetical protein
MSGTLLPTATRASATSSYFAPLGSGGGSAVIPANLAVSTLTVNSPGGTGIALNSAVSAGMTITGGVSAGISVFASTTVVVCQALGNDNPSKIITRTPLFGPFANNNEVTISPNFNSNSGLYIEGADPFSAGIDIEHKSGVSTASRGVIKMGGDFGSTMTFQLKSGGGTLLSQMNLNPNGVEISDLTVTSDLDVPNLFASGIVQTEQATGLNTKHQVKLFNTSVIDVGQLMPMATIRNASGGLEYASDSKIAQFGMMAPGSNFMTIPVTTYASASNVVLAPYTTLQLFTGGSGSGGSSEYLNQGNPYFSTFTATGSLNGNAFNSYKMFFGN